MFDVVLEVHTIFASEIMFAKSLISLWLLPIIIATPISEVSNNLALETSSHCGTIPVSPSCFRSLKFQNTLGQQDRVTTTTGYYSLLLNLWGSSNAWSGTGCAAIKSLAGRNITWENDWTWVGGSKVKSFTNVQLNKGLNKKLSAINSIPVGSFRFFYDVIHCHFLSGGLVMVTDLIGQCCLKRRI